MKIIINVADEQEAQQVETLLQDHDLSYHREASSEEGSTSDLMDFLDQNPPKDDILEVIPDPVAWQREMRKDRKLPRRP